MTEHDYLADRIIHNFYIVYKTTNIVNNRFYVGVHAQDIDPYTPDGYIGSGTLLKNAIEKYGKSSFVRETLYVFDNAEDAYQKESEIVNEQFLDEYKDVTYNLKVGGDGNFGMTPEHRRIISELWKGKSKTEEHRKKIGRSGEENGMYGKTGENHPRYGKKHSEETKQKMSERAKERGEEWMKEMIADRTGRIGITKDDVYKMVRKNELDEYLDSGWKIGKSETRKSSVIEATKRSTMERHCKSFGVETQEELKIKFEKLYHEENLQLKDIGDMFGLTVMQIKRLRDNLGVVRKTREQWLSTR